MKKTISLFILLSIFGLTSCNKFLTPDPDNIWQEEVMINNPKRAEGVLLNAYKNINNEARLDEVATDDAVTNELNSQKLKAATGAWTSDNNPFTVWGQAYTSIQYVNLFLEKYVDQVEWYKNDAERTAEMKKRLRGEAYALRAWHHFSVLQSHAGKAENGEYLGIPCMDKFINPATSDVNIARSTFKASVDFILTDIDAALELLPARYENNATGDNANMMNSVYGEFYQQRMCGDIMKMLKAQLYLLASSPAFVEAGAATAEDAAKAAADLISANGGLDLIVPDRLTYFKIPNDQKDKISKDVFWRSSIHDNQSSWEQNHFPPTLFGKGHVNPSQNLVDAFYDSKGYPIDHASTVYDPAKPFQNRDKRLDLYIIHNGSQFKGQPINTLEGKDGINATQNSTRTGYYMRKLLNEGVNITGSNIVGQKRFSTYMRYTELFLIYAEAANQAWGPKTDGAGVGFSAYDVMKKLRETAGFADDPYLEEVAADQQKFTNFVRNERRVELCFEGKRFWDIRRWNDVQTMKETVMGATGAEVEQRNYQDYMVYGPIPRGDVRKGLIQNQGWK